MAFNSDSSYDEIRRRWNASGGDNDTVTSSDLYRALRRNSLISRLRRRAFILFVLGCTGPFWMAELSLIQPVSTLLAVSYIAFMLFAAGLSLYWWYRLGKAYHYMTFPVVEARFQMDRLDKLRRNIKITSLILGIPVIYLLFYEVYSQGQKGEIWGAAVGLIIGGGIGLAWEFLNRRQVKQLKESFDDFEE